MKREILFKAKRIDNGEWVEFGLFDEDIAYNLDLNTICQYTGITADSTKNPQKVFEGDIIHIDKYGRKFFVERLGRFIDTDLAVQGYFVSDGSNLLNWSMGLEVLGNIHD